MHIAGSITFEEARAYGVLNTPETVPETTSSQVQQLVSGRVPGEVTFDGVAVSSMQPLQLYTRCADRIEAATLLATGQHLDIQA